MKEIKTTETIERVTGYEAFDKTWFSERAECEKYENSAKAVIAQRFKELIIKELDEYDITTSSEFPASAGGDCWYYALVCIKNEDDLMKAQMYQNSTYSSDVARKFTTDDIGKELVVTIGDRYDSCYIWGTLDECVERYKKALMKFYESSDTKDN